MRALLVASAAAVLAGGCLDTTVDSFCQDPAHSSICSAQITDLSPKWSLEAGGGTLTVTGRGFEAQDTEIRVGGIPLGSPLVVDSSHITGAIPAHASGDVEVAVFIRGNFGPANPFATKLQYYSPAMTVTGFTPQAGSTNYQGSATITGTEFAPDAQVTIGGEQVPSQWQNRRQLYVPSMPRHTAGKVDVVVTSLGRTGSLANAFEYYAWSPVPYAFNEGYVTALAAAPDPTGPIYAITQGGRMFRSADGAGSWTPVWLPFPGEVPLSIAVSPANSQLVLAGTDKGVRISRDGGVNWSKWDQSDARVERIAFQPSGFGAAAAGLARVWSSPDCSAWTKLDGPSSSEPPNGLAINGTVITVSNPTGIYTSGAGGSGWTPWGQNEVPTALAQLGNGTLVAITTANDFWWSGSGSLWTKGAYAGAALGTSCTSLAADAQNARIVYAACGAMILSSPDAGQNFAVVLSSLPDAAVQIVGAGSGLLVGTAGAGVFRWPGSGSGLMAASTGLQAPVITDVLVRPMPPSGSTLVAASAGRWVRERTLDGSWLAIGGQLPAIPQRLYVMAGNGPAYVVEADGVQALLPGAGGWQPVFAGTPAVGLAHFAVDPTDARYAFADSYDGRIFQTTDAMVSWTDITNDFVMPAGNWCIARQVDHPAGGGRALYMFLTNGQIYRFPSTTGGWAQPPGLPQRPEGCYGFAVAGTSIVVGCPAGMGVFRWSGGGSWDLLPIIPDADRLVLSPQPGSLYAASGSAGPFLSADSGANWQPIGSGLPPGGILSLAVDPASPNHLYAGTQGNGIYETFTGGL